VHSGTIPVYASTVSDIVDSRLLTELTQAKADVSHGTLFKQSGRTWMINIDEWGIGPPAGTPVRSAGILDDRYDNC